jgi:hypothetical protein
VTVNLTNINPWLHLSSQHASIFGYYVLWLLRSPLHPFVDLSKPLRAELLGSDDAVEEEIDMPDSGQFSITMSALSNPTLDHDPGVLPPARRLLHAYFLGLSLGVPHFQDAAMNTVCFIFAPRTTPPPALIEEVYEKSGPEVVGLKKLCIDYYIFWRLFFHQDISDLARWKEDLTTPPFDLTTDTKSEKDAGLPTCSVRPFKDYPPDTKTTSDMRTELPAKIRPATPFDRVRKEYQDVRVGFGNLGLWLRDGDRHGMGELCLNRIT